MSSDDNNAAFHRTLQDFKAEAPYRPRSLWPTHRAKRIEQLRRTPTEPVDPRPDWRDVVRELDKWRRTS